MTYGQDGFSRRERGERAARTHAAEDPWLGPGRRQGRQDASGGLSTPGLIGLALAAAAGVAAIGVLGAQRSASGGRTGGDPNRGSAAWRKPEIERSITIEDVPADELYRRLREPETLQRIMAPFAAVETTGDGQTRWSVGHDLGAWDMRLTDDRPGEALRWEAQGDDALIRDVSVRFRAAGNRGTVVALHVSLDPPGGMLGRIATQMLGDTLPASLASKSLHYFKALVQTGEIPTTERQPAARPDPR